MVHYNQLYELLGRNDLHRLSSSSLSAEASRCPPWSIGLETAGFYWVEYQADYLGSEGKEGLKHPDPRTLAPTASSPEAERSAEDCLEGVCEVGVWR